MAGTALDILDAAGATKQVDMRSLTGVTKLRQTAGIGDPDAPDAVAGVVNGPVAAGAYGMLMRRAPIGLPYHLVALATNNANVVKNGAGVVHGVSGFNKASYPVFLKFYNKNTAPNPASDTPVWTVGAQAGLPFSDVPPPGVAFTLGIAIAIVKLITLGDNTAVAADDCVVNIFKE